MSAKIIPFAYQQSFDDLVDGGGRDPERDFIASILLEAVMQSFSAGRAGYRAREWLDGAYAQSLFLLVDIDPEAALERLQAKWRRADAEDEGAESC